jgi:plastocyanin
MTRRLVVVLATATAALVAALPAQTAAPVLIGTVGPGFTITLTQNGKKVTSLKAGIYTFKISDKASIHDFHLTGPGGFSKVARPKTKTDADAVGWTGTVSFQIALKKGTYKYVCDPHATTMKGSFKVV